MQRGPLQVLLEIGPKRKVVAGALDWPGLERSGTSEEGALEKLASYVPRYAPVADRAGRAPEFARVAGLTVVERIPGSSSTDFWGVAHVPSQLEQAVLTGAELERRLSLLQAAWDRFDEIAAAAPDALRLGPRGGGRSRDEIVRHVYASERHNWWRKVAIREDDGVRLSPGELARHRSRFLDAIRAYNAEGKTARTWPIQFLVRRTALHVVDHAWEIEDRALPG
jgi:hypothetical protein